MESAELNTGNCLSRLPSDSSLVQATEAAAMPCPPAPAQHLMSNSSGRSNRQVVSSAAADVLLIVSVCVCGQQQDGGELGVDVLLLLMLPMCFSGFVSAAMIGFR